MSSGQRSERLTVSLPAQMIKGIEDVKDEMNINRSELVRRALEEFIRSHKRKELEKIAIMMKDNYERDKELTAFTSLDSEGFLD